MKKVRGVWLTNVASDVYNSKDNIFEAIELLARTGFNVVFPVVWNKGYTLYKSEVMRQHFGNDFVIDPLYQATGREPLAEIIEAARKFKLKIIPWFEFGFAASALEKDSSGEIQELGKHILNMKPEFKAVNHQNEPLIKPEVTSKQAGFKWMNALNPQVQNFMRDLILEVVQQYDVDGIQGDDRLPAFPVEGFDQDAADLFNIKRGKPLGTQLTATDPKWMQFRADILTEFLKSLCNQIRQVGTSKGKKLLISMAPHPRDFGFRTALQDTKAWLNLVDMMHPQLYRKTLNDVFDGSGRLLTNGYINLAKLEFQDLSAEQIAKISPGILMREGEYRIKVSDLEGMIAKNRAHQGAGEVLFFFEGLIKPDNSTAKAFRDTHYAINELGDEGPDVFKIQKLLIAKGLNPGEPDGIFGKKTKEAVEKFQGDASHVPPLKVDGKVGKNTLEKLGISDLQAFGSDLKVFEDSSV